MHDPKDDYGVCFNPIENEIGINPKNANARRDVVTLWTTFGIFSQIAATFAEFANVGPSTRRIVRSDIARNI
jgi:hypothetical protein